ncbi:MAG: 50S ribosomal protein L25 [Bacteroidota bacterium]
MEAVAVSGTIRTEVGKKATKAVRSAGEIPAILYSKNGSVHFSTTHKAVKNLIFTPAFRVAEIDLDGKSHRAIVKDIQWHPVTDEIVHLDFLELIDGHAVKVEIPVRFEGTAPGMRSGGKLLQLMRRVKVKANPESLVDELVADISTLELGQSVRVRDIAAIDGIEIMSTGASPLGIIEIPRALRSAATAEAKAERMGEGTEEEAATEE